VIFHELAVEEGVPGGGLLGWCSCGLLLSASGSVRGAQRRLWRKMRAHRGSVRASGPGGETP